MPRQLRVTQSGEMRQKPGGRALRFAAVEEPALDVKLAALGSVPASERIGSQLLAARHHEASVPTWSTSTGWQLDRFGMQAAACDQPRDDRVRIPHLPRTELVATPNGHRHVGH